MPSAKQGGLLDRMGPSSLQRVRKVATKSGYSHWESMLMPSGMIVSLGAALALSIGVLTTAAAAELQSHATAPSALSQATDLDLFHHGYPPSPNRPRTRRTSW